MKLPESYDVKLRKTIAQLAEERGAKPVSVHVSLSVGYKTLQKAHIASQSTLDASLEVVTVEQEKTPSMILPSFLQKRRTPTSIPKRTMETSRDYSGQTTPDIMLGR